MPCEFQIMTLDNLEKKEAPSGFSGLLLKKRLTLTYKEFIRSAVSSYSYTILELIAEVGGYVGLFLGISINQSIDLISQLVGLFSWIFAKLRKTD